MKLRVWISERYPYAFGYFPDEGIDWGTEIELSDTEAAEYRELRDKWDAWQKKLSALELQGRARS